MNELESYLSIGGNLRDKVSLAGHFADRISALELNIAAARRLGDAQTITNLSKAIIDLRNEAKGYGLTHDQFPTLYR